MARAAIVHPSTLLGKELRETLARDRGPFSELRLLSTDETEVGNVTDGLDGAAFILRADALAFDGVDVAFCCGPIASIRPLLAELEDSTAAVLLSTDSTLEDGQPVVAGLGAPPTARVLVSPHAAVVTLAHLLAPLHELGLAEAVATVIQPASQHEEVAFETILAETRALLAFAAKPEPAVFGRQLAFNIFPVDDQGATSAQLAAVLADRPEAGGQVIPVAVQLLQGGIFHGLSLSLHVRLRRTATVDELVDRWTAGGVVALVDDEERGLLGPIDSAGRDEILLGPVRADQGRPNAFWVWAVADNLTRGGALNALAVGRQLL